MYRLSSEWLAWCVARGLVEYRDVALSPFTKRNGDEDALWTVTLSEEESAQVGPFRDKDKLPDGWRDHKELFEAFKKLEKIEAAEDRHQQDDPYMELDPEPDFDKGQTYYTTSIRKRINRESPSAPLALGDRVAQIRVLLAAGASIRSLAQRYGIPEAQIRAEARK
jgi:hypothetical protein